MRSFRFLRKSLLMLCLSAIVACANITIASEYEPIAGQDGKDVMWLPTCQVLVDKMLDMGKVTPQDYLIDFGSGDGRLVISAAKRGARALGIEYNPDMVALSKRNAAKAGITNKAQFIQADIFESNFSQATVITMFLLEEINIKLRPKILDLKPGTRIVSNYFTMGEWKADQIAAVDDKKECDDDRQAHSLAVAAYDALHLLLDIGGCYDDTVACQEVAKVKMRIIIKTMHVVSGV